MNDIIIASVISTMAGLAIGYFFKRWNREYITTGDCSRLRDGCRVNHDQDDMKFNEFKREMRDSLGMMKGLLLVIASGGKVSVEELKNLLK